jgi:hypothetical protein
MRLRYKLENGTSGKNNSVGSAQSSRSSPSSIYIEYTYNTSLNIFQPGFRDHNNYMTLQIGFALTVDVFVDFIKGALGIKSTS